MTVFCGSRFFSDCARTRRLPTFVVKRAPARKNRAGSWRRNRAPVAGNQKSAGWTISQTHPPMRAIWKGSISFGLVNIPVTLQGATRTEELKFRLLRNKDLSPVNYKRVAERDGK